MFLFLGLKRALKHRIQRDPLHIIKILFRKEERAKAKLAKIQICKIKLFYSKCMISRPILGKIVWF